MGSRTIKQEACPTCGKGASSETVWICDNCGEESTAQGGPAYSFHDDRQGMRASVEFDACSYGCYRTMLTQFLDDERSA